MTKKPLPDPTRGNSLYNYRVGKLTSPQYVPVLQTPSSSLFDTGVLCVHTQTNESVDLHIWTEVLTCQARL